MIESKSKVQSESEMKEREREGETEAEHETYKIMYQIKKENNLERFHKMLEFPRSHAC